MVTPGELARKTMTEEKKKSAKNDIFAFYIGRPISYVLTIPFLAAGMKPNTVSFLSPFPSLLGFLFLGFGDTMAERVTGTALFFLWNFMDGVDGNIARYTNQTSKLGVLWDATSGYLAMTLMYFAAGISVMHTGASPVALWPQLPDYYYIIFGALTSICALFSRLVMHKKMILFTKEEGKKLSDKSTYSGIRLLGLNLTSPSGFVQVILLLAVLLNFNRAFVMFYFIIQLTAAVYSLTVLLKE